MIIPHISPADIREIKRVLELFELSVHDAAGLFDDARPPLRGAVSEDSRRAGRKHRISPACPAREPRSSSASPALTTCHPVLLLEQEFGVPLHNLPLPIGLQNMDRLVETLEELSGRSLPDILERERGWLLDGMADSHKFNADGRPIVFGEPELVYAFSSICVENGASPGCHRERDKKQPAHRVAGNAPCRCGRAAGHP